MLIFLYSLFLLIGSEVRFSIKETSNVALRGSGRWILGRRYGQFSFMLGTVLEVFTCLEARDGEVVLSPLET